MKGFCSLTLLMMFCSVSQLVAFDIFDVKNLFLSHNTSLLIQDIRLHFTTVGKRVSVKCMMPNTTFYNISAISWWQVLLVEETGVLGESYRPASVTGKLYSIILYRVQTADERNSNSQIQKSLIAQVCINPTIIQSQPRRPQQCGRTCITHFHCHHGGHFKAMSRV